MAFKLRHYAPLSTLKLIYYSMFNSILQYSLINWGRAPKCYLQKIKTIRNLFYELVCFVIDCPLKVFYSTFGVLKLDDMTEMEYAKFIFKFNKNMLPEHFNNYFVKLETIHYYQTRQKAKNDFLPHFCSYRMEEKDGATEKLEQMEKKYLLN